MPVSAGASMSTQFAQWLRELASYVGFGIVQVGGIVGYRITADDVADLFDVDGLGLASGRFQGWQICNGNNGTDDLNAAIAIFDTSGAGLAVPLMRVA